MPYFKVPSEVMDKDLSHAELSLYVSLCHMRNRFYGPEIQRSFWCSDRSLAYRTNTSTRTVYLAKIKLRKLKLISFHIGPGNKTFYTIRGL